MASDSGHKRLSFSIESILSENSSKLFKPTYSPYRNENGHEQLPCYGTESLEERIAEDNGKK